MKIKLEKRYKYAGDIYKALVEKAEFPTEVATDLINGIKDADVVEVVRCKNCKYSGMYAFGCGEQEHLACLEIEEDGFVRMATTVNDDDYCSRGERKEE